jgi:hypothetical protein
VRRVVPATPARPSTPTSRLGRRPRAGPVVADARPPCGACPAAYPCCSPAEGGAPRVRHEALQGCRSDVGRRSRGSRAEVEQRRAAVADARARECGAEAPSGHQPSIQRLLGCPAGEFRPGAHEDVGDRALDRGHGHAGAFGAVTVAERRGVDGDSRAATAEGVWHGHAATVRPDGAVEASESEPRSRWASSLAARLSERCASGGRGSVRLARATCPRATNGRSWRAARRALPGLHGPSSARGRRCRAGRPGRCRRTR